MTTKRCSVPSCTNTVDDRSFECDEHFGFTTIGPGTVKPNGYDVERILAIFPIPTDVGLTR